MCFDLVDNYFCSPVKSASFFFFGSDYNASCSSFTEIKHLSCIEHP